ncbi:ribonuclease H-like domain-containing protein [Aspergillus avenaceus]|uniref:Ribonuclease H-like domain-containing protein n=1 Tax=Aspergillus avenaceus TaxID=36643 RepID=A0A5N6TML8_ASPAV|nr:ribonuclease H-like domain-containing protein [Aspergillus avenaceus]
MALDEEEQEEGEEEEEAKEAQDQLSICLPSNGKAPTPDPSVRTAEDAIQKSLSDPLLLRKLQLDSEFPSRPGYGKKGKPVVLWANYFQITPDKDLVLHQYVIDIQPSATGRKRAQVIRLLLESPELAPMTGQVVTDFKSILLSREELSQTGNELALQIIYRDEKEDDPSPDAATYRVHLSHTNTLRVSELIEYLESTNFHRYDDKLHMVQALNILVNHYSKATAGLVSVGAKNNRTFTLSDDTPKFEKVPLAGGLTAIRGFFSSVRLAACRVLVNVNVSNGTFYDSGLLVDLMKRFQHVNGRNSIKLDQFLHNLRGCRLHLPQRKNRRGELIAKPRAIHSLARPGDGTDLPRTEQPQVKFFGAGSKNVKFWLTSHPERSKGKEGTQRDSQAASGRWISVYDFFLEAYNIRDEQPDLPVINIGSRARPSYVLAQVFAILPGQIHNGKLSPRQTQDMIKFAVRPPLQNISSIVTRGRDTVGLDPQRNSVLQLYGISATNELITVNGRILDQPNVLYKGVRVKLTSGSWNMLQAKCTVAGRTLTKWSYLLVSEEGMRDLFPTRESLEPVIKQLGETLVSIGLSVGPISAGRRVQVSNGDITNLDTTLKLAANNLDLLYIILPAKDSPIYPKIKRLCDVGYGLLTVCSVGPKLSAENGRDQYMRNLALKFNLKLGGTNQVVDFRSSIIGEDDTIIVGLDVTHPTNTTSGEDAPSVAGMVASIDKLLGQWPASIQLQSRGRKEEIDNLDVMLKRHLGLWKTKGKHAFYPKNILVYRDGISEGQYSKCLTEELPLMQKACREIYPKDMQAKGLPHFCIIIVSKRHHTRFYATDSNMADRNGNTLPGTIVDRGVTDPHCFSFFLQPHSALQGTTRNAFYFVAYDEIFSQRYGRKLPPGYSNVAEIVHDLTLQMSYLVGRATKSVQICCAARYADLVCDRARCYLEKYYEPSSDNSSVGGSTGPIAADVLVHETLRDTMFYI